MRALRFYVINKSTRKSVYMSYREQDCREHLESLENKEDYCIGYKWLSI